MSPEDTLLYERRNRTRSTTIAVVGGVMFMIAAILGVVGPHAVVNEATLSLITQHHRATLSIVAAVVNAGGEILIALTLLYLWRCASTRGGGSMPLLPFIVIIGTVIAVVAGVAYAVDIGAKASDFVTTGAQTYDEADRLTRGTLLLLLQILSQLGALLIAIAFVLSSLVSMRVGLLPRFLGYIGILAGVLVLFPIIVIPVVQLYWLFAVAILFSGNWPSGLPPAWTSGLAEPWPPAAEMRARRAADAQQSREQRDAGKRRNRRERVSDAPDGEAADSPQGAGQLTAGEQASGARNGAGTRSSTPKRKRKRRH